MTQPQTLGIEYEITDLHDDAGSAPHGPARPERLIDQEVAHLSGGLFDSLPRVELPLDALLPLPTANLRPPRAPTFDLPPALRPGSLLPPVLVPRGDSLYPTATDLPPPPPVLARAPAFPWGQTAIASAAGVLLAMVLMRPSPSAPAAAPLAAAPLAAAPSLETAPPKPATGAATQAPARTPVLAAAPARPALRAAAAPPAPPRPEAAPVPSAAPVEAAPVTELAPSPPAVVDPLHRPDIEPPGLPPQRAAVAIAGAARGAASCLDADDLRRTMAVSVTFAPSGHATRATIDGGPHRGTAAGSCIAQRLRTAVVKPFEGPPVTLRTSITAR